MYFPKNFICPLDKLGAESVAPAPKLQATERWDCFRKQLDISYKDHIINMAVTETESGRIRPYELRTEFTSLIAKSTSLGLSDTTLFALCNLPQWYQFLIYFLGNAFWLFFVSLLWGSTNPLIRKGSKGIEEIHRSSRIQQFFAEVFFLASNWKVLWIFVQKYVHVLASNWKVFWIFVQEYVLLFVLAWPRGPWCVTNQWIHYWKTWFNLFVDSINHCEI